MKDSALKGQLHSVSLHPLNYRASSNRSEGEKAPSRKGLLDRFPGLKEQPEKCSSRDFSTPKQMTWKNLLVLLTVTKGLPSQKTKQNKTISLLCMQTQCLFPFPTRAVSAPTALAIARAQPQIRLFVLGYFHTLPKFADNTGRKKGKGKLVIFNSL